MEKSHNERNNPSTYKISLIFQNGLYLIGEIIIYSNSPSYSYEVNKKSGRQETLPSWVFELALPFPLSLNKKKRATRFELANISLEG